MSRRRSKRVRRGPIGSCCGPVGQAGGMGKTSKDKKPGEVAEVAAKDLRRADAIRLAAGAVALVVGYLLFGK